MKMIEVAIIIDNDCLAVGDGNVKKWYEDVLKQESKVVMLSTMMQYTALLVGVYRKEIGFISVSGKDKSYPVVDNSCNIEEIDEFNHLEEMLWEML